MNLLCELEDFPVGSVALTPSGRRVVVVKHLTGASKYDHFSRIVCRYEGSDAKDLVTLQPHQLRQAPPPLPEPPPYRMPSLFMQLALAFD